MRRTSTILAGALPMLLPATALAQTPQQFQGTERAPYVMPAPPVTIPSPPPAIGTLGGLPVRMWTPVEAPYNPLADRNGAADPILGNLPAWETLLTAPPS